ncbi:MAG: YjbQ family protein [Burkholderiales bacterium]|nr:YjbQ family protein [Burkholderiales bacterium]
MRRDLETLVARLVPGGDRAFVQRPEDPDDMAAHARAALASRSLPIPVAERRLAPGARQGIYPWEHRAAPRTRSAVVTVIGTAWTPAPRKSASSSPRV